MQNQAVYKYGERLNKGGGSIWERGPPRGEEKWAALILLDLV